MDTTSILLFNRSRLVLHLLLTFFIWLACASTANAQYCTTTLSTVTYSPAAVSWSGAYGSVVKNTSISNWDWGDAKVNVFACSRLTQQTTFITGAKAPTGQTYIDPTDGKQYPIFPTGVTGIGYVFGVADYNFLRVPMTAVRQQLFHTNSDTGFLGFRYRIRLIFTGTLPPAGTYSIPSQLIGTFSQTNTGPSLSSQLWINGFSVTIKPNNPTCSFKSNTVAFPMGSFDKKLFTGVNSVVGWAANRSLVSAGCNAANLTMRFTGTIANATVPSAFITSGTAKGVGIQLWRANGAQIIPNSAAINFGAPVATGGAYTFSTRYVQTLPTITAGTANGSVTVTVTYT